MSGDVNSAAIQAGDPEGVATLSERYSDFVAGVRYEDFDAELVSQVKRLTLDLLGCALGGYALVEFARLVVEQAVESGGREDATIVQTARKVPALNAAFANAACAHALDMDDGHRFAALHPGTVVIPAALAAAELAGATTKQMIAGIVCGYEVAIRIGMAINPSSLSRGFHSTGTVGPFGAAAAAAAILRLDREQTVAAFGIAGLQGAGLLQVNHDESGGGEAKAINSARAAMSGLFSAMLAGKGAKGPRRILEGKDGFLGAFASEVNTELLTRGLGTDFEIRNAYTKFYASGRHSHACIDAALDTFRASGLSVDDIEEVRVETYATAIRFSGIVDAANASAARFSIAYSVAIALVKDEAGPNAFRDEVVADERVRRLAARVHVGESTKWQGLYPGQRGATVTVAGPGGRVWTAEAPLARGEPENPASWADIEAKFRANATLQVPPAAADRLAETIQRLETVSLADFVGALR